MVHIFRLGPYFPVENIQVRQSCCIEFIQSLSEVQTLIIKNKVRLSTYYLHSSRSLFLSVCTDHLLECDPLRAGESLDGTCDHAREFNRRAHYLMPLGTSGYIEHHSHILTRLSFFHHILSFINSLVVFACARWQGRRHGRYPIVCRGGERIRGR